VQPGGAAGALLNLAIKGDTGKADSPPAKPLKEDTLADVQVVYLPDFEEQMSVEHVSVLSKSKIGLAFRDGWQLRSVTGNFDATDVPVQILKTVQNAIKAAGAVEGKRLELAGQAADASGAAAKGKDVVARLVPVGANVI